MTPPCAPHDARARPPQPELTCESPPADDPTTVGEAITVLVRHPAQRLVRRWNWKAAVTSSLLRGGVFFAVNLTSGTRAAAAAFFTEFVFRAATAGFFGAVTQTFRSVKPRAVAALTASLLIPALSHSAELLVHWLRGTPALGWSITASLALTTITTTFSLHAMRHGVMTVGPGSRSLVADFRALPGVFFGRRAAEPGKNRPPLADSCS